jgi:hypothetical protein
MRIAAIILSTLLLLAGNSCKKDKQGNCEEFKQAAYSNDVNKVRSVMESYLQNLPSSVYNEQNIQLLTQRISKCDISSLIYCFDCIDTYPSQTEISINFSYNGAMVHKTIDLTYNSANKIVFRNMHD